MPYYFKITHTKGRFSRIGCDTLAQTTMAGYHGTIENKAKSILDTQRFYISNKPTEWLGTGSYFFQHPTHAEIWAKRESRKEHNRGQKPVVLEVFLTCDESHIFDLDDPANLFALNDFMESFFENVGTERFVNFQALKGPEKWCLCCNLYRKMHPDIAITKYTFADPKKQGFSGFRTTQTQLCVSKEKQNIITSIKEWKA